MNHPLFFPEKNTEIMTYVYLECIMGNVFCLFLLLFFASPISMITTWVFSFSSKNNNSSLIIWGFSDLPSKFCDPRRKVPRPSTNRLDHSPWVPAKSHRPGKLWKFCGDFCLKRWAGSTSFGESRSKGLIWRPGQKKRKVILVTSFSGSVHAILGLKSLPQEKVRIVYSI